MRRFVRRNPGYLIVAAILAVGVVICIANILSLMSKGTPNANTYLATEGNWWLIGIVLYVLLFIVGLRLCDRWRMMRREEARTRTSPVIEPAPNLLDIRAARRRLDEEFGISMNVRRELDIEPPSIAARLPA